MIFTGKRALPRLVANSLERLEIPHNDGLDDIVPGIFESAEWQAWIELQRSPRLNSFLRFLNALPDPAVVSTKISRQVFEKFCAKVTRRCCWTISNCCANSVPRTRVINLSRPPKLCARCRFSRRAQPLRSFSNRLTPRLPISTGSNTRSNLPMSRAIGRSVSMRNFHARSFCGGWKKQQRPLCRPLSRRRSSVCARAISSRWHARKIRNGRT